jgi:hypothetical protein
MPPNEAAHTTPATICGAPEIGRPSEADQSRRPLEAAKVERRPE